MLNLFTELGIHDRLQWKVHKMIFAMQQVITRAYILASRFTMKLVLHNSRMYVFSSFFDSLGLWNTLPGSCGA